MRSVSEETKIIRSHRFHKQMSRYRWQFEHRHPFHDKFRHFLRDSQVYI